MMASELEFFLFKESLDEAAAKGYADLTPHSQVIEDYHILQTTRDEYLIRDIRNGMDGAGVPVEFSKGEAGKGQHEINLVYGDAVTMADRHVIYKNGAKEIAGQHGRSITFMAKYSMDEVGSSCHVHSSVWDADATESLMWSDGDEHHFSPVFRGWLGGSIAAGRELAWMFAPTVNSFKRYQPESWAPTALAWGHDNRTCGYRIVGHGASYRLESRIPGADANPYLAFAATIAAGLHGITNKIEPPPRFDGNAYVAPDVDRVPWNIVEAIDAFRTSSIAIEAFGADVHAHLLNTAEQEWVMFNRAVTDWERRRNFDQWRSTTTRPDRSSRASMASCSSAVPTSTRRSTAAPPTRRSPAPTSPTTSSRSPSPAPRSPAACRCSRSAVGSRSSTSRSAARSSPTSPSSATSARTGGPGPPTVPR